MRWLLRSIAAMSGMTALTGTAYAQVAWTPATEIVGQPVQVTTNGVVNTVTLNADGTATIATPGGRSIPARWTATPGQLCLNSGAQECWPYNVPFQAGQPVTVTSTCNATSTWLAQTTNGPPGQSSKAERGR